jgi:hypothetical protein
MNELTEEWVEKAEEDFDAADALLYGREVPIAADSLFPLPAMRGEISQSLFAGTFG